MSNQNCRKRTSANESACGLSARAGAQPVIKVQMPKTTQKHREKSIGCWYRPSSIPLIPNEIRFFSFGRNESREKMVEREVVLRKETGRRKSG